MKNNENKKSSKKPLVIGGMALLLALVGFTGISAGQTYAKYITSANVETQQATVAKWGYVVTANADGLFGTDYNKATGDDYAKIAATDTGVAVNASGTDKVVAPGTTGSMTFSVHGQAEVNSKLTFDVATGYTTVALTAPAAYEPILWSISGAINGTPVSESNLKLEGMLNYLNGLDETYAPNTDVDIDLTVTWVWKFHVDETTDKYDTCLGDLSALDDAGLTAKYGSGKEPAGNTKVKFGITVTVEQVQ